MSDIPADVGFEELPAWRGILDEFAAGSVPHCRAVSAPPAWHPAIVDRIAELTLGEHAEDGKHPDIMTIGSVGTAPLIEDCRALAEYMAIMPETARRKLGVVMAADRMRPNAANSLLKLAEEPPAHACILFMTEGGSILPTLRSRARFTVLKAPPDMTAERMPASDAEWLAWAETARKKAPSESKNEQDKNNLGQIAETLAAWSLWLLSEGSPVQSMKAERLRLIAEDGKLSAPMMCDLVILALKEDIPFEHLFGDVW